jgi:hypothetical protein
MARREAPVRASTTWRMWRGLSRRIRWPREEERRVERMPGCGNFTGLLITAGDKPVRWVDLPLAWRMRGGMRRRRVEAEARTKRRHGRHVAAKAESERRQGTTRRRTSLITKSGR